MDFFPPQKKEKQSNMWFVTFIALLSLFCIRRLWKPKTESSIKKALRRRKEIEKRDI